MKKEEFKKIYEEIEKNKYDFGTGSWAVNNQFTNMTLNKDGEYVSEINFNGLTDTDINILKETNILTSTAKEDKIADDLFSKIPSIKYDKRLGFFLGLYVGHVNENNFREEGSSGGFGTWIFKELLEKDMIDGVIHVKKSESAEGLFEYGISRNIRELIEGSKTKYYPVEYSKVINYVLETPGRYAIIGLPSYISDLRLLAKEFPILEERIIYSIGLVCGHQKSSHFADFLAWQCGIEPGNLLNINFRKKLENRPSSDYGIEIEGVVNYKKVKIVKPMKDLSGNDWGQGFFKVRASDFSDDVMNETADMTLGDAWLDEYVSDSTGNNIVIVRNPILKKIIEDGAKDGLVTVDEVTADTIYRSQASHFRHTHDELSYRLYKQQKRGAWIPNKRVNISNKFTWTRKKIQDCREEITFKIPKYYKIAIEKKDIEYFLKKSNTLTIKYHGIYQIKRILRKLHIDL